MKWQALPALIAFVSASSHVNHQCIRCLDALCTQAGALLLLMHRCQDWPQPTKLARRATPPSRPLFAQVWMAPSDAADMRCCFVLRRQKYSPLLDMASSTQNLGSSLQSMDSKGHADSLLYSHSLQRSQSLKSDTAPAVQERDSPLHALHSTPASAPAHPTPVPSARPPPPPQHSHGGGKAAGAAQPIDPHHAVARALPGYHLPPIPSGASLPDSESCSMGGGSHEVAPIGASLHDDSTSQGLSSEVPEVSSAMPDVTVNLPQRGSDISVAGDSAVRMFSASVPVSCQM